MTTLTIDGRALPLHYLWLPEMSLSSARAGRVSATYALSVDKETVLSALDGPYERFVQEMKEDEALTGDTDLLGKVGYPPLEVVIKMPEVLDEVLGGWALSPDGFNAVLPPASGPMHGTWAIDTVDLVWREGERIVFRGTCYAF
ncbi:MAG TPA: hypothetical protein VFS20_02570 [Longimicrobium sp.]|nr:hypothetical protein [Longimicrobium sp.]